MGVTTESLIRALVEHLELTAIALLIAILVGVPLGIHIARARFLSGPVLAIVSTVQTIPSVAFLGFLIPLLGIGMKPAVVVLFLYSLLPIVRNTYTGIVGVDAAAIEAARGVGMRERQILLRVKIPQALPVLMAGIRTATVLCVGVTTVAALIGAGGLGSFIFRGIAMLNTKMILAGAVPAGMLALVLDLLLAGVERWITPPGLRKS